MHALPLLDTYAELPKLFFLPSNLKTDVSPILHHRSVSLWNVAERMLSSACYHHCFSYIHTDTHTRTHTHIPSACPNTRPTLLTHLINQYRNSQISPIKSLCSRPLISLSPTPSPPTPDFLFSLSLLSRLAFGPR